MSADWGGFSLQTVCAEGCGEPAGFSDLVEGDGKRAAKNVRKNRTIDWMIFPIRELCGALGVGNTESTQKAGEELRERNTDRCPKRWRVRWLRLLENLACSPEAPPMMGLEKKHGMGKKISTEAGRH